MHRVLELQTESRRVSQYRRNIGRLEDTAQASYQSMKGLQKVSDRAGEIAVLADGSKSPDSLKLYAIEVTQLIRQAVGVANATFQGEYLLAGTRSDQAPFVLTEDFDGNVTSVVYQGNESVSEAELAEGETLSAHTLGTNVSGSGPRGLITDSRFGADFFNHLISLQSNLLAGDTDAIANTDLPDLLNDEENILINIGSNGAVQARLEAGLSQARSRVESLEAMVSKEADADIAEVLVRLTQTQTAYQAALQSGASILSRSLLDFLR
jgi:flagellar hook-associated protein 3 FlgL